MFHITKYIPKTSFISVILESSLPYKSNINYYVKKFNHIEYLIINSSIDIKMREHENYKINEEIMVKYNTKSTNTKVNYSHIIYYNDNIFSKLKFGKHKPTLWSVYNSSIKKLYYEIINSK
jgi:hypothetical protein